MSRSSKPAALAALFAALADTTRLRLLNLMAGREVCVCYFVEILRQGQPKISRHLAYLRRAGIVAARREGKWMHYRICEPADAGAAAILTAALASLRNDKRMLADLDRLDRACWLPRGPILKFPSSLSLCASDRLEAHSHGLRIHHREHALPLREPARVAGQGVSVAERGCAGWAGGGIGRRARGRAVCACRHAVGSFPF